MATFEKGAVVKLKGETQLMAVENTIFYSCGEAVSCVWFDEDNKLQRGRFAPELLEVTLT